MNEIIVISKADAESILGMLDAVKEASRIVLFPEAENLNKESDRLTEVINKQLL